MLFELVFTKTTGFIYSIRVGLKTILSVEVFFERELSICLTCITVLTIRNIQKVLPLYILLNFRNCIPQPLQGQIPQSRTQFKNKICSGVLWWKSFDSFVASKSRLFDISIKTSDYKFFLDIQTLPQLSPITTSFYSSTNVSVRNFFL